MLLFARIKVYLNTIKFIKMNTKSKKFYLNSLQIQITFPIMRTLSISLGCR